MKPDVNDQRAFNLRKIERKFVALAPTSRICPPLLLGLVPPLWASHRLKKLFQKWFV